MDYMEWGNNYLDEAKRIRQQIDFIRASSKPLTHDERMRNLRRANMLYDMYLECKHTGILLQNRYKHTGKEYNENKNT